MKKLFAVALLLCMLCTCAFAEEESTMTLSWSDIPEEVQNAGQFTQIAIPDYPVIVCWIPANMDAVDVSMIEAEVAPVAAFQTADGAYTVSIYALQVTGVVEYLNGLAENGAELNNVNTNGIDACSFVQKGDVEVEGLIIPMSDNLVLSIACTPVDGDEDWDQVKGVIFSSIQVAE